MRCLAVAISLLSAAAGVHAHDPSAWGGAFRSRDFGGSWLSTDAGLYVGGAMALAIHPRDANHLLYATDTRLLRSHNGGRDWQPEAQAQLQGPVTAVAFDAGGSSAVASNAAGVFFARDGQPWQRSSAPSEAVPARQIIAGAAPGQFILAGSRGLFSSRDHGGNFQRLGQGQLPDAAVALAVMVPPSKLLAAVSAGRVWRSSDDGSTWQDVSEGLPEGSAEALTQGAGNPGLLWVAAADAIYVSDDRGTGWRQHGARLPMPGTSVRALAVSPDHRLIVLATHRGVLRSDDGGTHWQQTEGALPVHLEAGLVMRDPHDAQTLYTGFALTPYSELYRRAQQGNNLLSRTDPVSLAGGAAFFLLILIAGAWLARRLSRGQT